MLTRPAFSVYRGSADRVSELDGLGCDLDRLGDVQDGLDLPLGERRERGDVGQLGRVVGLDYRVPAVAVGAPEELAIRRALRR